MRSTRCGRDDVSDQGFLPQQRGVTVATRNVHALSQVVAGHARAAAAAALATRAALGDGADGAPPAEAEPPAVVHGVALGAARMSKLFEGYDEEFGGTVTSWSAPYFGVTYDDGDAEELELADLAPLLLEVRRYVR